MIERIIVWLWRIRRCQGFGIQSPWAYAFARNVINERLPYYAYERLNEYGHAERLTTIQQKCGLLFFRLANYVQPQYVLNIGKNAPRYATYFRDGCNRTTVLSVSNIEDAIHTGHASDCSLVHITAKNMDDSALRDFCLHLTDGTMLVLDDIGRSWKARRLWRRVKTRETGIVTFDLHYCGIVCFDSTRYRQDYVVNF